MMKKYLFLSTLLATLVGCTHEDLVPESSSISFSKIEASIDGSADTRVDMNWYQPNVDNKTLSWSDDDLIGVYSDEQDIEAF